MCLLSMAKLQSPPPSAEALPLPKRSSRLRAKSLAAATSGPPVSSQDCIADIEDSSPRFSDKQAALIRTNLLTWYDANHRKLPWRYELTQKILDSEELQQRRAYATWVSEVMLQQTRVTTVIDYFNRWMEKWPTVKDLASATEESGIISKSGGQHIVGWTGLLQACTLFARAESYGGSLPSSAKDLQKIRGIGKYTAGAIASIAFGQPVPVVDGNVIRVLCRLKALSDDPTMSSTLKSLWSLAEQLVDVKRPGDLNQALMEFGATSCSLTSPHCARCPVQEHCEGYILSRETQGARDPVTVTDFPLKVIKPAPRQEYVAVCVLEKSVFTARNCEINQAESYLLLVRRPKTGLLAGLWEFPSARLEGQSSSLERCKSATDKYLKETLGLQFSKDLNILKERKTVGTYKHVFSHIHMHMTVEWMHIHNFEKDATHLKELNGIEARWIPTCALHEIGLTSGVKKVYQMFLDFREGKEVTKLRGKRTRYDKASCSKLLAQTLGFGNI
ncbi:hypothetical protein L7F22_018589 [Adiantum nelumboides]|nr:hypothetical protein [Adiantum nelumboides]